MKSTQSSNVSPCILILLAAIFAFSDSAAHSVSASSKRGMITGYLKMDARGRTLFVRSPYALEPGVRIEFASLRAGKLACVLGASVSGPSSNQVLAADCPRQTFSYEIKKAFGGSKMVKARLENADTPWHRLRVKELLLMPSR